MISLAVWRETLMIHARGFIFSQRHKGRKGFLRNVGLGGLGGLARDINDSRTRIYILAKAQRTQRIPTECWTWRLGERWFMQIFCSRKGAEDAKDSYGMSDLADLAAWREILHVDFLISQRRGGRKGIPTECWTWRIWRLSERWFTWIFCTRKGAEDAKDSYGMSDLADLAAWRETLMIHTRGLFSRKGAKDAKDSIG